MFGKISKLALGMALIGGVMSGDCEAMPTICEVPCSGTTSTPKLRYIDDITKKEINLDIVLKEYNYVGASLPKSVEDMHSLMERYSKTSEYLLRCDSKFLASIKALLWTMKFSLVKDETYPNKSIEELTTFCNLISKMESGSFRNFLISILFRSGGLQEMYSDIKDTERKFGKNLQSKRLQKDLNGLLDIVDPDETMERLKR